MDSSIALQAIGVVSTIVYVSAVTAVILVVLDKIIGLRVEMDEENEGLDLEQHGEHVL